MFVFIIRRPPRSPRTDTPLPDTPLFRSRGVVRLRPPGGIVNKGIIAAAAAIVFVCGIGVGYSAKPAPALALYHGKTDQEAARGLLELALEQAEDGSWEPIGGAAGSDPAGFKAQGPALSPAVLAGQTGH